MRLAGLAWNAAGGRLALKGSHGHGTPRAIATGRAWPAARAMRAAFQRAMTAPGEAEASQAWAEAHHLKAEGLAEEAAMRAAPCGEAIR